MPLVWWPEHLEMTCHSCLLDWQVYWLQQQAASCCWLAKAFRKPVTGLLLEKPAYQRYRQASSIYLPCKRSKHIRFRIANDWKTEYKRCCRHHTLAVSAIGACLCISGSGAGLFLIALGMPIYQVASKRDSNIETLSPYMGKNVGMVLLIPVLIGVSLFY